MMNNLNDEQLNRVVYLGVDLSESNDNTSVAIVSVDDDDNIRIEQLEKENENLKEGKHAHWHVIDADSEGDEAFCHYWATLKCSRCGYERETEDGYIPDYCEGCGSKMEIGNEE